MSSAQTTRIVIVGAGYTGIWTYRFLEKRIRAKIRRGEIEITVICPKNYHSLHGFTAEALCGVVAITNRQTPLRLAMRNVRLVRGYAEKIDTAAQIVAVRMVNTDQVLEIGYDHLVLANGSYDAVDAIAGMHEYGWSLKAAGGVLATRNHIIRMLENADSGDPNQISAMLRFVVAGGGFAGVEIAANLAEMLHSLSKLYPVLTQVKPHIVLVHSGSALLLEVRPRFDRLADYAEQELKKWNVEIMLNTRLVEVKESGAALSDGTFIAANTVISTVGQRLRILPGTEHLPHTASGLIITDDTLHVQGETNIWAGGDAAQVIHSDGKRCPANALWAVMHGVRLGDNLARTIQGKPIRKFSYRGMGHAASLGIGKGATELNGVQFTGWIAWVLRLLFCMYFIPSRRQSLRALLDWVLLPFLGRYQNSLEINSK